MALILPNKQTLIERDRQRQGRSKLGVDKISWLHDRFNERLDCEDRWRVLDNTELTPEETTLALLEIFEN